MKASIPKIAATAALAVLASCANNNNTASNRTRAKFLDEVRVSPALKDKAVSDVYSRVYFAPVGVSHLKEQGWWASQSAKTQGQLAVDAKRLAAYTNRSLRKAATNYPAKRMQVVDHPGPGTLVVETSIVELVPAKAYWNTAATAAGFAVPGAGLLGTFGKGAITFEGRLRDGGTGASLATFRERSEDKTAAVNLNSYTWYQGSEANIDELAAKAAQTLNTPKSFTVKASSPIKLIAY
ncbi:MAG: DUF3313 family protein [Luteolibacter sp.]